MLNEDKKLLPCSHCKKVVDKDHMIYYHAVDKRHNKVITMKLCKQCWNTRYDWLKNA